jgi:hypothetical protein
VITGIGAAVERRAHQAGLLFRNWRDFRGGKKKEERRGNAFRNYNRKLQGW